MTEPDYPAIVARLEDEMNNDKNRERAELWREAWNAIRCLLAIRGAQETVNAMLINALGQVRSETKPEERCTVCGETKTKAAGVGCPQETAEGIVPPGCVLAGTITVVPAGHSDMVDDDESDAGNRIVDDFLSRSRHE